MVFSEYSFAFKFENQYYFMRHYEDFNIQSKDDAYKVIREQANFTVNIWTFKEIKEGSDNFPNDSVNIIYNEMKRLIREDKLKKLENGE